jgi:hypothetical protein
MASGRCIVNKHGGVAADRNRGSIDRVDGDELLEAADERQKLEDVVERARQILADFAGRWPAVTCNPN